MSVHLVLKHITLHDLRCHQRQSWQLANGINIFRGENGCGKTTVLEAAYLMAHGRSFRQSRDPELVNWQAKRFMIQGSWLRYGPLNVAVKGKRGRTEVKLQGKLVARRKELSETLPVIADAPQAKRLVDGATSERRRWLDQLLMACEPSMQAHNTAYLRAMMQRSRLLRRGGNAAQLDVWEHQLVKHGSKLRELRRLILQQLNHYLAKEENWMDALLSLHIAYTSQTQDVSHAAWLQALKQRRDSDKKTGRCGIGPHADVVHIMQGGREIRAVGSRGQQKLASIALKLAECATRYQYRHVWPLLLLDDCMEALDDKRRLRMLHRLQDYTGQILITAPNEMHIPASIQVSVWNLEGNMPVHQAPYVEDLVKSEVATATSRMEKAA